MNELNVRPDYLAPCPCTKKTLQRATRLFTGVAFLSLCLVAEHASAGTATWTGAVDTNWSNGGNWSGGTGAGGVPSAADSVLFTNAGVATVVGAISNVVDVSFGGTISSLQYSQTNNNGFQNTLIAPGTTLTINGATGPFGTALFVGTPSVAVNASITASIQGAGATLTIDNTNANISLSQATSASTIATLNLTNLDTFNANISKIAIGDFLFGIGSVAAQGSLVLAKTNTINTSWVGNHSTPYSTAQQTNAIQLGVGSSSTLGGINSMLLGLTNGIFTDSIGVGGVKSGGSFAAPSTIAFNPVFTNASPTAYFRGINGSSSRIALWGVADTSIGSGSSAQAFGKVDLSGGSVDAMIDSLLIARDRFGSGAVGGVFTFTAGNINVNSLIIGDQGASTTGNACTGFFGINAPAGANVTNAVLSVNNNLELGHTTLTAVSQALNTSGTLGITNATVYASNVVVGASSITNTLSLNNGTLIVTNSVATNAAGVANLVLNNSVLGFTITDNSLKALAQTLTTAGTTNVIQLASAPVFATYPQQFALIKYTSLGGVGYNFGLTNIPASAPGAFLMNNVGNHSIDLVLPVSPAPVVTSQPQPFSGTPGSLVILSVVNTGNTPLTYQWFYTNAVSTNSLTDGSGPSGTSTLSGTTNSSLTITDAQPDDSGGYFVVIGNNYGSATSSVALVTISSGSIAPGVILPHSQTVTAGQNTTISASVSGSPLPTLQWQSGGVDLSDGPGLSGLSTLSGTTTSALTISNAQLGDQATYTLVAVNSADTASNSTALTVIVTPTISSQPRDLVVTNGARATFSVMASGVPAPSYQWLKNGNPISSALNLSAVTPTFNIPSVSAGDAGTYSVLVSNIAGPVLSSNVTLTVNSTMAIASLTPANGATGVCYDTPLTITFTQPPTLNSTFTIKIFNATNPATPVDTLNLTLGSPQSRVIGGVTLNAYPVLIFGNTAIIAPHSGVMTSNQTYFVTIDDGAFKDSAGAFFAGITNENTWEFSTKPTGPANPTNLVVAADGSGDFATVQGSLDFIPNANSNHVLLNIRNGVYHEIVRLNSKNNITLRGQDRHLTAISYANDDNINGGTAARPMFGVLGANDIAFENFTLTNSTPKGGSQAESLYINTAKRVIIFNMELNSYQDTLLINNIGDLVYAQNNHIQGDTDFIWGQGTAYFTNCEIETLTSGSGANLQNITQARTPAGSNGFSFVSCQLTRTNNTITLGGLGRALGFLDGNVAYINCLIDDHISGWGDALARSWEFGNSNITGTLPKVFNGVQLVANDPNLTNAETASLWLYGWVPQLAPNILTQPASQSVNAGQPATFTVVATGIPDPTYQFLHGSTPVQTGPSPTLVINNPQSEDIGNYSVVVSTPAGSVTSSTVTLSVNLPPLAGLTAVQTSVNTPVSVAIAKILAGAFDPDGDAFDLTAVSPTSAQSGTVVVGGGNVTYTPPTDYVGGDQFTYTLTDTNGNASIATVNVSVLSTNGTSLNQVGALTFVGPNPQVTFAGIPNRSYDIQRTASLTPPDWVTVGTITADAHGQIVFTDTNPLSGQAFYRTATPVGP